MRLRGVHQACQRNSWASLPLLVARRFNGLVRHGSNTSGVFVVKRKRYRIWLLQCEEGELLLIL